MSKTPSIAEIARHNAETGGHYFDRDTLRFFGQTQDDFQSKTLMDGRIIVYAYTHSGWKGLDLGGRPSSLAVYDPKTGEVDGPEDAEALKEQLRKE